MKKIAILKTYFDLLPGESIQEFAMEVKELSTEEKTELAQLAAIELGVQVDD